MKKQGPRWISGGSCALIVLASATLIWAAQLPLDPVHSSGQNVTPAYEGWYDLPNGTINFLVGYYNRNTKESIDIPVGPNNHLDPGGPDMGQPTHFLPGRQWGVFVINVPKNFGTTNKKITWTITANGKPATIPLNLDPVYNIAPFKDATNNTPPFLAFSEGGPFLQGPPLKVEQTYTATVGQPMELKVFGGDDAIIPPGAQFGGGRGRGPSTPFTVTWLKFRGPGDVTFDKVKPAVQKADFKVPAPAVFAGTASTTATFSAPGDYILEVVGNDISGDGGRGFQCCWTTVQVKVTVKPAAGA